MCVSLSGRPNAVRPHLLLLLLLLLLSNANFCADVVFSSTSNTEHWQLRVCRLAFGGLVGGLLSSSRRKGERYQTLKSVGGTC